MSKSKHEEKPQLIGPWRSIHGAVWLIGLAILAAKDWWWPGILVLVAISGIVEAMLMQYVPGSVAQPASNVSPQTPSPASATPAFPTPEHRLDLLPTVCPNCGGPIRGHEVKWTGLQSADCPYCGVNLPMKNS